MKDKYRKKYRTQGNEYGDGLKDRVSEREGYVRKV